MMSCRAAGFERSARAALPKNPPPPLSPSRFPETMKPERRSKSSWHAQRENSRETLRVRGCP